MPATWLRLVTKVAVLTLMAGACQSQVDVVEFPELDLDDVVLADSVKKALAPATAQVYRVYELPTPGDFSGARRGIWEGGVVIDDPTIDGVVDSFEFTLEGQPVEFGYHVAGDRASHVLATPSGTPVGLATGSARSMTIEIDLNGDRVADVVDRVDLATGRELLMVAEDELWALEEMLTGGNLLCHERLAEVEGLLFANPDPGAQSPGACEGAPVAGGNPRVTSGGLMQDFLDNCEGYVAGTGVPNLGLVMEDEELAAWGNVLLAFGGAMVGAGASVAVGGIATGGVLSAVGIGMVIVGASIMVAGAIFLTSAAEEPDVGTPGATTGGPDDGPDDGDGDGDGDGGEVEEPPGGEGFPESPEETWERICEARAQNQGKYPNSVDDLENLVSPVDNRCDDPVTQIPEEDEPRDPEAVLCGESGGDRVWVGNLFETLSAFDDDCDEPQSGQLCEPSWLTGGDPSRPQVAWSAGDLIGVEACPPESCDPSS